MSASTTQGGHKMLLHFAANYVAELSSSIPVTVQYRKKCVPGLRILLTLKTPSGYPHAAAYLPISEEFWRHRLC